MYSVHTQRLNISQHISFIIISFTQKKDIEDLEREVMILQGEETGAYNQIKEIVSVNSEASFYFSLLCLQY